MTTLDPKPATLARLAAPLAAITALLASCAPYEDEQYRTAASDADERQCFFVRSVNGFREAPDAEDGSDRIYVDVGASDTYLFETFGSCPELDWSWDVGFDTDGRTSICNGLDVDLSVPDSTLGPRRCPVRMVRKLGPEEDGAQ